MEMKNTDYNNRLFLVVQNDGNGDQCGSTYKERLLVAECHVPEYRRMAYRRMVERVDRWHIRNGYHAASGTEKITAIDTLEEYYQQHLKEGAATSRVK